MQTAAPERTPRNATTLAEHAAAHGWAVSITYAEGIEPSGRRAGSSVTSVAVRLHRRGEHLAGVWIDGKFFSGLAPFRRYTLRQLRERVAA